jgi:hypothetical protein
MSNQQGFARKALKPAALAGVLCFFASLAAADAPAWINDSCAELDCGAAFVGVGQSNFLPEMRFSSAVAYAQAVRSLSSLMSARMVVDDRLYDEGRGRAFASAVQSVVASPLGNAMTKIYGDDSSDLISVAIELNLLEVSSTPVYAQEYVDVSSGTLYVRLIMSRSAAPIPAFADGVSWKGGRIRVSSQDIRAGRKNELTLWVEDQDTGTTWVEYWPTGGADIMRDGKVASSYVYDKSRSAWKASAVAGTAVTTAVP